MVLKTAIVETEAIIPTPSGEMPAFLYRPAAPAASASSPAVLLLMEAFGLTPHIRDVAARIAAEGYIVLTPDLYYRELPHNKFGYEEVEQAMATMYRMDFGQPVEQDLKAAIAFLKAQPDVSPDRIGVTGFCLGGGLTFLTACRFSSDIAAAAPFYGMVLDDWVEAIQDITMPVYLFHGGADPFIPPERVQHIEARFKDLGKAYRLKVYPDADHGFFCHERSSYNAAAAEDAWQELTQFLRQHLNSTSQQGVLSPRTLPSLFVSHGAPDLPLYETAPAVEFLKQLGTQLPRPKAILAVSAHWETRSPAVSTALQPKTIHDFGGFPPETYALQYPAPGAPELAERVEKLLTEAGTTVALDPNRGLDHGAWEPLLLMYPDADIPVTQLSVQPHLGAAHHLQVGRAIAPLRQENVLILASGAATHNLRAFGGYAFDAAPPDWVTEFDQWLETAIAQGDTDALLNYRQVAPHAAKNHPSEEHFLPLLVALGAGGDRGTQLHHSTTYGILSMAAYAFG